MMNSGLIYFIEAVGSDAIKIGWAMCPNKRLLNLQCGCPLELRLVGTTPGTIKMEKKIHLAMAGRAVRGEWFIASAARAILARIEAVGIETALQEEENRVSAIRQDVQEKTAKAMALVKNLWPEVDKLKRGKTEAYMSRLMFAPDEERQAVLEVLHGPEDARRIIAMAKRRAA